MGRALLVVYELSQNGRIVISSLSRAMSYFEFSVFLHKDATHMHSVTLYLPDNGFKLFQCSTDSINISRNTEMHQQKPGKRRYHVSYCCYNTYGFKTFKKNQLCECFMRTEKHIAC